MLWIVFGDDVSGHPIVRIVRAATEGEAVEVANRHSATVLFTSAWLQGEAWA